MRYSGVEEFIKNKRKYTIVDVGNDNEIAAGKIFPDAETIPLNELRKRADELPNDKPLLFIVQQGTDQLLQVVF